MKNLTEKNKLILAILATGVVVFGLLLRANSIQDLKLYVKDQGNKRPFDVHLPTDFSRQKAYPLVIAFHAGGSNPNQLKDWSELNQKSDQADFIVVYPYSNEPSWNLNDDSADLSYIKSILKSLNKRFNIDQTQIFATGHSSGAMFTYLLACELPDRIAAIAPVGSYLDKEQMQNCSEQRKVSIIHFHGTQDKCVPFNGGVCGSCTDQINSPDPANNTNLCPSVAGYLDNLKKNYDLPFEGKITYQKGDGTCISSNDQDSEVTLCSIKNMGHSWPGTNYGSECDKDTKNCSTYKAYLGKPNTSLHATDLMWEFFQKHPLKF